MCKRETILFCQNQSFKQKNMTVALILNPIFAQHSICCSCSAIKAFAYIYKTTLSIYNKRILANWEGGGGRTLKFAVFLILLPKHKEKGEYMEREEDFFFTKHTINQELLKIIWIVFNQLNVSALETANSFSVLFISQYYEQYPSSCVQQNTTATAIKNNAIKMCLHLIAVNSTVICSQYSISIYVTQKRITLLSPN